MSKFNNNNNNIKHNVLNFNSVFHTFKNRDSKNVSQNYDNLQSSYGSAAVAHNK